jgi:dihydroflavonol-4-reductase
MLGSNLSRELLKRGYEVRALVEPGRNFNTLKGVEAEIISGDILDQESLKSAVRGCNYVIHAASSVAQWPIHSKRTLEVNINGTENIINAAADAKVERLVYVGSAACYGSCSPGNPSNELTPEKADKFGTDYIGSKMKATEIVKKAADSGRINSVIIHPTFMLGPFDSGPGSGAMILAVAKRKVPGYTRGGKNYVDVRDVAVATANALTMGRNGESYITGNLNLSYYEIFRIMAEETSVKAPGLYIPPAFTIFFASLCTLVSHFTRRMPLITIPMASASNSYCYVSSQKAVDELALPQSDIRTAIVDAVKWFRENGYL